MTLQQQVIKEAGFLSEEELLQVIQFMNFLRYNKSQRVSVMVEQKKKNIESEVVCPARLRYRMILMKPQSVLRSIYNVFIGYLYIFMVFI